MGKINLTVLFLEYSKGNYKNSFDELKQYLKRFDGFNIRIVKIDNAVKEEYFEQVDASTVKINGNNACWEFSGWQNGIEYLNKNNIKSDVILFVNDSFLVYGREFIETILRSENAINAYNNDLAVGCVDSIGSSISIEDYLLTGWIRTNCFFITQKILDDIKTVWSADLEFLNKFVDKEYSPSYFRQDAPANKEFQEHIIYWLTKGWHKAFDPKDNWNLFRLKVLAILNEKILTAKIEQKGYKKVHIKPLEVAVCANEL